MSRQSSWGSKRGADVVAGLEVSELCLYFCSCDKMTFVLLLQGRPSDPRQSVQRDIKEDNPAQSSSRRSPHSRTTGGQGQGQQQVHRRHSGDVSLSLLLQYTHL